MISFAILLLFFSFYLFFNTSKRASRSDIFGFENYVFKHPELGKGLGLFLLILSLVLHLAYFGVASGTLLFFINLMTIGSLIIVLVQLKIVNYKNVLIFFFSSSLLEYFFL